MTEDDQMFIDCMEDIEDIVQNNDFGKLPKDEFNLDSSNIIEDMDKDAIWGKHNEKDMTEEMAHKESLWNIVHEVMRRRSSAHDLADDDDEDDIDDQEKEKWRRRDSNWDMLHQELNKNTFMDFGDVVNRVMRQGKCIKYQASMEVGEKRSSNSAEGQLLEPLEIYVDGPFGSPSSNIYRAEHAVLIGTGIGVTPFASILQSIMHRYRSARVTCPKCEHRWTVDGKNTSLMKLKKVDFFWINRDHSSFEWFVNLLSQLEIEQQELGGSMGRYTHNVHGKNQSQFVYIIIITNFNFISFI